MKISPRINKILVFILKICFSFGLFLLLLNYIRFPNVTDLKNSTKTFYLFPAFLFFLLSILLSSWRWSILSIGSLEFIISLKYTLVGMFYGAILPGSISGDIAKGTVLALRNKENRNLILPASILFDKIIGFLTLILLFLLSALFIFFEFSEMFLKFQSVFLIFSLIGICILIGTVFFFLLPQDLLRYSKEKILPVRLHAFFEKIISAYSLYKKEKGILLKALFLSLTIHIANILQSYFLLESFGSNLSFVPIALYYSILSVSLMLPVTVAGIGLRDMVTLIFYQNFKIADHVSIALSMGLLIFTLTGAFVGGILHLKDIWMKENV